MVCSMELHSEPLELTMCNIGRLLLQTLLSTQLHSIEVWEHKFSARKEKALPLGLRAVIAIATVPKINTQSDYRENKVTSPQYASLRTVGCCCLFLASRNIYTRASRHAATAHGIV